MFRDRPQGVFYRPAVPVLISAGWGGQNDPVWVIPSGDVYMKHAPMSVPSTTS